LLYGGFIQGVANKRVMDDFLGKCEFLLSRRVVKVRLLEQKQLNIDTNILHNIGLEFKVDSKNKNFKFGLLLKFGEY